MRNNVILGAAIAAAMAVTTGCSQGPGSEQGQVEADTEQQGAANPTRHETPETPSRIGPEGTLVTDAADVTDTLGVFTAGAEPYVVDSNRRAVYLMEDDADGSGCSGGCLRDWAPVTPPSGQPTTDGALAPVLVGVIERPDGTGQMTYNEHPLYHYAGDQAVGDTNGHRLSDEWGTWYLVTPQGRAVGAKEGPMPDEPGGRDAPPG